MNPRSRFIDTINCKNDEIPLFCPAIYDYKVNFSNGTLNLFGQDAEEFEEAVGKEINLLHSEVITCGYDIYNVEAEAIGINIERGNEDIFPETIHPLISSLNDIDKLPDLKEPAGRMPMFIAATRNLNHQYHDTTYVRGAVSGPFTLAGKIHGHDNLMINCMMDPSGVYKLMEYATDIIITYIQGYLKENQDVVIFDSMASPPLTSPELYRKLVLPFHSYIFSFLQEKGVQVRPLIMGGNTLPVMEYLVQTGANQLLLDYVIPANQMKEVLESYKLAFRINIDPGLIANASQDQLAEKLRNVLDVFGKQSNLLIGTGILSPDTPLENILFIKRYLTDYYSDHPKT